MKKILLKIKPFVEKCLSLKGMIALATIGIWILVLQNFGIIPVNQNVYVDGGNINAYVSNTVNVSGSVDVDNTVDVSGRVDVDNWYLFR